MTITRYVEESDSALTLRLQVLFHETVNIQAMLDNIEVENVRLKDERRELTLKLNAVHAEISQLVREMKHRQSGTEAIKIATPQTLSAMKQGARMQQTG